MVHSQEAHTTSSLIISYIKQANRELISKQNNGLHSILPTSEDRATVCVGIPRGGFLKSVKVEDDTISMYADRHNRCRAKSIDLDSLRDKQSAKNTCNTTML